MNLSKNYHIALIRILSALSVVFGFASCGGNDGPEPPEPPTGVSRTVLVYMLASSNGLGASAPRDYDDQDLDEMLTAAEAGDLGDGRLLVFHSSSDGTQILKEVTAEGINEIKSYDSNTLPQSSERMNEVFDDMKSIAPAAEYGLILWGHGTGWLQDGISEVSYAAGDAKPYSYGWEHNGSQAMNITTLAKNLEGRDFKFLYMDCCYMASVEVAYQLRHAVNDIVAYPTEVLCYGMPYDINIKYLFSAEPDLVGAAKGTMFYYEAMHEDEYRMCTVSVLDTRNIERLAAAVAAIYEMNNVGVPAGFTPQRYETSYNCRYYDFASYIRALDSTPELLAEFEAALADVVVYEDATDYLWGRLALTEHSGLSTFIMKIADDTLSEKYNYDQLEWFDDVASKLIK